MQSFNWVIISWIYWKWVSVWFSALLLFLFFNFYLFIFKYNVKNKNKILIKFKIIFFENKFIQIIIIIIIY